jgi:Tfp pilus assembly protein PilN
MDEVNLLPEEHKPKRHWRAGPLSAAVTFLLCVGLVAGFEICIPAHWATKRAGQMVCSLAAKRVAKSQTERKIQDVEKSLEPLEEIIVSHPSWSDVLISLTKSLPEDLWLTRLSLDANLGTCCLTGMTTNPASVFNLISSLRGLPQFDSVALSSINKEANQGREVVKYEITCKFAQATA